MSKKDSQVVISQILKGLPTLDEKWTSDWTCSTHMGRKTGLIMETNTETYKQEITLPRKEGRPLYIALVPPEAITIMRITEGENAGDVTLSFTLTDEQWAEYAEIPLEEFLKKKAEAMCEHVWGDTMYGRTPHGTTFQQRCRTCGIERYVPVAYLEWVRQREFTGEELSTMECWEIEK